MLIFFEIFSFFATVDVVNQVYNSEESLSSVVLQVKKVVAPPSARPTKTNRRNSPLFTRKLTRHTHHSNSAPNKPSNINADKGVRVSPVANR